MHYYHNPILTNATREPAIYVLKKNFQIQRLKHNSINKRSEQGVATPRSELVSMFRHGNNRQQKGEPTETEVVCVGQLPNDRYTQDVCIRETQSRVYHSDIVTCIYVLIQTVKEAH